MNRTKLKNYAPQARRDFIQAVTDRAAFFGLTATKVEPVAERGDSVLIGGKAFPRKMGEQRKRLEERVRQNGFQQTMEALAYTWFNRLVAIRFMELHDYLENGEGGASYRVLSNPDKDKPTPEILEKAELVTLEMLDKEKVIDLKLDGTKEVELYRLLLIAECNALNSAMPFLFERIDDETELVLSDNLLHSDSLIRKLVNEIDEEDWQQVEIIGWLYQFYISEKKDEVIGKVVASEDIPAATQLFTPNWIVKYLVQNTLGRQWLATYPQSAVRQQMDYYIEPAEQTPEVQEQLKAITPTSLNPEEITLLDPACGSGHILVEAYDLFKAIYQERGYRAKDIPRLILQKNLFGLEIDDRAAQLAAFALMMKARADDRRIFSSGTKPNVLAIQESKGLDARDITAALNAPILNEKLPPSEYLFEEIEDEENPLFSRKAMSEKGHVSQVDIATLLELFEDAKTFGSLIQVSPKLGEKLPSIEQRLRDVLRHGDLSHASSRILTPLLHQATVLGQKYDAVVANPPYMGGQFLTPSLKSFAKDRFPDAKSDLFAMFIKRGFQLSKSHGILSMVTMESWLFISSFEQLRSHILDEHEVMCLVHIGFNSFPELNSKVARACAFSIRSARINGCVGTYTNLNSAPQSADKASLFLERGTTLSFVRKQSDFCTIPGHPIAYWVSSSTVAAFQGMKLADYGITRRGLQPGDVDKHVRLWHEVSRQNTSDFSVQREKKWFLFNSGGKCRRWFGNIDRVVNWEDNGKDIKAGHNPIVPNEALYFQEGVTWSKVTSSLPSFRFQPAGVIPGDAGPCFFSESQLFPILAFLNSSSAQLLLAAITPTLNMQVGDLATLPVPAASVLQEGKRLSTAAVAVARTDWNSFETSWEFQSLPVLKHRVARLLQAYNACDAEYNARFATMKQLEEANNRLFIEAYGLQDELSYRL